MNIKELSYFTRLYHENNFTKVAQYFNVSQPTITAAIQRLEKELDTQLVIRDQSHKELIFTESGRQFEKHAEQILQELKTARSEIRALNKEKVRFGLPPIIGSYYFPFLSARLSEKKLLQNLETYENGSKVLLNKLINGQLDMALLGSVRAIEDARLTQLGLARKKFNIIVGPQHPLAEKRVVAFKDLIHESFIQLDEGFVHSTAFHLLTRRMRRKPEVIYRSNDIQIIKGMVANNVGISFLTEMAVFPSDSVVALELSDEKQPEFLISLAYRANHILTPMQQGIVDLLTENKL